MDWSKVAIHLREAAVHETKRADKISDDTMNSGEHAFVLGTKMMSECLNKARILEVIASAIEAGIKGE